MPRPRRLSMFLLVTCLSLAACGDSTAAPAPVAPTPDVVPSTLVAPSPSAHEPSAAMPDLNGKRLSDAEVLLSAAGFMSVRAVDATGRGRKILEKNNWIVERQQPPAGADLAQGTTVTLGVAKPTDAQGDATVEKGVVPDVVRHDLQDAQEALRGAGFFVLLAKDGLGQQRYPLVDRNWIVLGQSAKAGSSPEKSATIELTVVKFGEPTGDSGCES